MDSGELWRQLSPQLKAVLDFLGDNEKTVKGVGVAWVIVSTIFGGMFFLFRKIFGDKKSQSLGPMSREEIGRIIEEYQNKLKAEHRSKPSSTMPQPSELTRQEIDDITAKLSKFREVVKPQKLSSDIFPKTIAVRVYEPTSRLEMVLASTSFERIFVAVFCLPHYLIFPSLAGSLVLDSLSGGTLAGRLG